MANTWQLARSLRVALFTIARSAVAVLCVYLLTQASAVAQDSTISPADLIGSWTLVSAQRIGEFPDRVGNGARPSGPPGRSRPASESTAGNGRPQRPEFGQPSSRGLLVLDGAGNVFEFFSSESRDQEASDSADLNTYGGFWGSYRIDQAAQHIVFEARDGVSPNVNGLTFSRRFRLDDDMLVLTSTDEPDAQANRRWTWQRNPVVDNLSPLYREVTGFWQHVEEGRLDLESGELDEPRNRAPSVIVYTPSGYVGVHFPPEGRNDAAEDEDDNGPTRLGGYIGYFGTLNVYPGEVTHNILSGVSPGSGSILRRFAEIEGDELIVTLQSVQTERENDEENDDDEGPRGPTVVRLKRLSSADHMLPPQG